MDEETQLVTGSYFTGCKQEVGTSEEVSVIMSTGLESFLEANLDSQNKIDTSFSSLDLFGLNSQDLNGLEIPDNNLLFMNSQVDPNCYYNYPASQPLGEIHNNQFLDPPDVKFDSQNDSQLSYGMSQSQDDHVQSVEIWPGKYNFQFALTTEPSKKYQFSTETNKLYVMPKENFELQFKYDFAQVKRDGRSVKLVCFIRNTNIENAHAPVSVCNAHLPRTDLPEEEKIKSENVLLSVNDKAIYLKDDKGRLSIEIPLKSPAAGCEYIPQLLNFQCFNSCKVNNQKQQWTAVFELRSKSDRVLGRQSFEVKVCACPKRDFHSVEKKDGKRKSLKKDALEGPKPKRGRPSSSAVAKTEAGDSFSQVFDSQESVEDENILDDEYKRHVRYCKFFMKLENSPNDKARAFGVAFKSYVDNQIKLCKALRLIRAPVKETIYNQDENAGPSVLSFDDDNRDLNHL